DGVAAVAGVPHEGVVAGAHLGRVVALAADDEVVAVAADQHVGALAAGDDVIARAAVDGELDDIGREACGADRVVAAQRLDDELVVGRFGPGDVHGSVQADYGVAAARADDLDVVGPARAVDGDRVGRAVAGAGARHSCQVKVDRGHVGAGQVADVNDVEAALGGEVDL